MYDQDAYYSRDIFEFNRHIARATPVSPEVENSRACALAWMREIARSYGMTSYTWSLAAAYLDRLISYARSRASLESRLPVEHACAALYVAHLLTNSLALHPVCLCRASGGAVEVEGIVAIELELAECLHYAFRVPTVADFFSYFRLRQGEEKIWDEVIFVGELALLSSVLSHFHPALLATACLTFLGLGPEEDIYPPEAVEACRSALADFLFSLPAKNGGLGAGLKNIEKACQLQLAELLRRLSPGVDRASPVFPFSGAGDVDCFPREKGPPGGETTSFSRGWPCEEETRIRKVLQSGNIKSANLLLGEGTYAEVWSLRVGESEYAVKIYFPFDPLGVRIESTSHKVADREVIRNDFAMEATASRLLASRHIANAAFIGILGRQQYLVTELCQGDLRDVISDWPRCNSIAILKQICGFTTDILRALALVHSAGIIHCDVKPDNILIREGVAKLTDFGTAQWQTPPFRPPLLGTIVTSWYRPIEHFQRDFTVRPSVDLWSLGCVIIEMLTRDVAFRAYFETGVPRIVFETMGKPPSEYLGRLPWLKREFDAILHYVLPPENAFEGRLRQARESGCEWLADTVMQCLDYDPDRRTPAKLLLERAQC